MKDKKARDDIGEMRIDVSGLKMTVNVLHEAELNRLKYENINLKYEIIELKEKMETMELRMVAIGKQLAKVTKSDNEQEVKINKLNGGNKNEG